jgi:hypothetical protein
MLNFEILMKKILLFFFGLVILAGCNNELDLIEEWKDIPIVYGVLDPSDTAHYIRIEKAFLDDQNSAYDLAQVVDSLYYKDLDVNILRKNGSTTERFPLVKVDGNLEGYKRESGVFIDTPNYLYKILSEDLDLKGEDNIELQLIRGNNPVEVSSKIKTVGAYGFLRPRPDDPEKINLSYANHLTIRWGDSENAEEYEVYVITHYKEKIKGSGNEFVDKEVIWKAAKGVESNSVLLESKGYFTFLAGAIEDNNDVIRDFENLEFKVIAVGKELHEYIAIGGANLGITASQEIPQYSNLSEGIGVFSSKWEISLKELKLIPASLDSVRNGIYTKHLNF